LTKKDLCGLIEQLGYINTPAYFYHTHEIDSQIKSLRRLLTDRFRLYYSVKANPNPALVSYIYQAADGVEVASEGELYLALQAKVKPCNILFIGPGKKKEEIRFAIERRIKAIVAESWEELLLIQSVSKQVDVYTSVALRINPAAKNIPGRLKMGGGASPFGIDEELIPEIIAGIQALDHIRLIGLQVYLGTQVLDEAQLVGNFAMIGKLAMGVNAMHTLEFIDFGGGFGIPYYKNDRDLDLHRASRDMHTLLAGWKSQKVLEHCEWIAESGRFIVAESGILLTRVLYKKKSRGSIYVVLDGGSNIHAAAAGIGRFARHNFPVTAIQQVASDEMENVQIVGPLCTPTDVIVQDAMLPVLRKGDYVVIQKSGAYGMTSSPVHFLGHALPGEWLLGEGGAYSVIRKKGEREDHYKFYR